MCLNLEAENVGEIDHEGYLVTSVCDKDFNAIKLMDSSTPIRPTKPNPCPFCGNRNPHLGYEHATAISVSCQCGARVVVNVPDEWYPNVKPGDLKAQDRETAMRAVGRWNTRP